MVQALMTTKDQKTLLKAFVTTFTSEDFIVDLIRVTLHPAEFGSFTSEKTNSVNEYMRTFLKHLNEVVKRLNINTSKTIQQQIQVVNTLLTIRESSSILLTYDSAFQHLASKDLITTKLIQKAIDNRLNNHDDFRKLVDNIINIIHSYHEIISVSSTITLLDNLQESISDNNLSPFEALKNYKDLIITAFNDLSKLQSLNKSEAMSDYFVISDNDSCQKLAKTLVEYISSGYSFFKTGYHVIDNILGGIESSSTHLISAPSNHGKSIMLINLCKKIIKENLADFDKNDCILFVTLEDDIYKLSRRFMSVFGHYSPENVKMLFSKGYEVTRSQQIMGQSTENDNKISEQIQTIFNSLLQASIANVTQGKVSLVIKHCNENTFSYGDLGRFIDRLTVEGFNVKMVFIDYLDAMISSFSNNNGDEYTKQGAIVQEGRTLSRIHKIPIIIPTQNSKSSENVTTMQSNQQIGDSYKKIRFSDFVYMMRMREDLNFLSEFVRPNVIRKDPTQQGTQQNITPEILAIKDKLQSVLMPLEVKITKSKDSSKNQTKFLLFCSENLCIYNDVQEYLEDVPTIIANNNKLAKDINILLNHAIVNTVTENFDDDVSFPSMFNQIDPQNNETSFGVEDDNQTFIPSFTKNLEVSESFNYTDIPTPLLGMDDSPFIPKNIEEIYDEYN